MFLGYATNSLTVWFTSATINKQFICDYWADATTHVAAGPATGARLSVRSGSGNGARETILSIDLESADRFDVVIMAMDGREVARPIRQEYLAAGHHDRVLDLDALPNGTYLVSMVGAESSRAVSTMLVLSR